EREPHLGGRTPTLSVPTLAGAALARSAPLAEAAVPDDLDNVGFLEVRLQRAIDLGLTAPHDRVAGNQAGCRASRRRHPKNGHYPSRVARVNLPRRASWSRPDGLTLPGRVCNVRGTDD